MNYDESLNYMEALQRNYAVFRPEIREAIDASINALTVLKNIEIRQDKKE